MSEREGRGLKRAAAEGGNDPACTGVNRSTLCSPCLIVMDELYSLARSRSDVRARACITCMYLYMYTNVHKHTILEDTTWAHLSQVPVCPSLL